MKSTISFVVFLLLFSIFPATSFGTDYYIATKSLNVRTGAGIQYSISFTLQEGDKVEVLSRKGNWYQVNYRGKTGYAYSQHLQYISDTETDTYQQSDSRKSGLGVLIILGVIVIGLWLFKGWIFEINRKRRREYYNEVYLKSDEWKRKRYVVLRRDNWRCVYCGGRATQVHHKKYAKRNIGKEPIEWLVSVCKSCHDAQHH
jgi:uncharacterized protein YraI